jgi:hypothetical protein
MNEDTETTLGVPARIALKDLLQIAWRFARRPLFEAAALYAFFWFSAHIAIARISGGDIYDLTPKGLGLVLDVVILVFLLTGFHLVYTLPARFARKWLAAILKGLMYLIFVLFIGWVHWTRFVAVQLQDGRVIAINHWPQPPREIPRHFPPELRGAGAVRSLTFRDSLPEGIASVPVYRLDQRTSQRLLALAQRLSAREEVR